MLSSAARGLPGLCLIVPAILLPSFRRADGWLTFNAWIVLLCGFALFLIGVAWRSRWRKTALYFSLSLGVQSITFLIIQAPNYGVLQHYANWLQLLSYPSVLIVIFLALVSLFAFWRYYLLRAELKRLVKILSPLQWGVFLGLITFSLAIFSRSPIVYAQEIFLSGWIILLNGALVFLTAVSIPADALQNVRKLVITGFSTDQPGGISRIDHWFPLIVAVAVTVIAAGIAWFVMEGIPHIPDDTAFLFMAKYFSKGMLYLPAPPDKEAFKLLYTVNDGTKWYGYGFLGWPAVLSIGVLLKSPWLVNPVLAGLTILAAHSFVSKRYTRNHAHWTILLIAISPWFLFMSASMMTHSLSLLLTILALLAIEQAANSQKNIWGILAALCLAGLFLTRPLEGLMIGGVLGLRMIGFWGKPVKTTTIALVILLTILVSSVHFFYNKILTNNFFYFPMARFFDEVYYPGAQRLGFGRDIGNVGWEHIDPLPGHGPLDVIINANQNFFYLNFETFGWGIGSLLFAGLFFVGRRWNGSDKYMLAVIMMILLGNSFYFFSGAPDYGARYWYQILLPLIVLTIRGIEWLSLQWRIADSSKMITLRIIAFVALSTLIVFLAFMPWRSINKYHHYRGMRADIQQFVKENHLDNALILIQEKDKSDYPSAFIFNPPTLIQQGPIFARDISPAIRQKLSKIFPDREVWIVAGSSELGGPFSIVEGPLFNQFP